MPRKISLMEKREWLESYESGKAIDKIATSAGRDVRTIKKGIDEARREADARAARAELLKEALHKHQESLLKMLDEIFSILTIPSPESAVLPWDTPVFTTSEAASPEMGRSGAAPNNPLLGIELKPAWGLLQEHLKRDPVWRMLTDWQKARTAHLNAKIASQRKTVGLLEGKTGYKLVGGRGTPSPPFVYIQTAAHLLFEVAIHQALRTSERKDLEDGIIADAATGEVRYGGSVLAKAPGKEEECKSNLLAALRELQVSAEAISVANTYRVFSEHTVKTRNAVEEISLLGLLPGQCRICRRLGL